jgi:hypothetical protein
MLAAVRSDSAGSVPQLQVTDQGRGNSQEPTSAPAQPVTLQTMDVERIAELVAQRIAERQPEIMDMPPPSYETR